MADGDVDAGRGERMSLRLGLGEGDVADLLVGGASAGDLEQACGEVHAAGMSPLGAPRGVPGALSGTAADVEHLVVRFDDSGLLERFAVGGRAAVEPVGVVRPERTHRPVPGLPLRGVRGVFGGHVTRSQHHHGRDEADDGHRQLPPCLPERNSGQNGGIARSIPSSQAFFWSEAHYRGWTAPVRPKSCGPQRLRLGVAGRTRRPTRPHRGRRTRSAHLGLAQPRPSRGTDSRPALRPRPTPLRLRTACPCSSASVIATRPVSESLDVDTLMAHPAYVVACRAAEQRPCHRIAAENATSSLPTAFGGQLPTPRAEPAPGGPGGLTVRRRRNLLDRQHQARR